MKNSYISKKILFSITMVFLLGFVSCEGSDNQGDKNDPKEYSITFDANGGTGGHQGVKAVFGQPMPTLTGGAPALIDSYFTGYFDAKTGGTKYYNADLSSAKNWDKNQDTKLFAQWSQSLLVTSVITFNQNEGTGGTSTVTATFGQPMPEITQIPMRTDFIFTGYYDEQTEGTKYYNADLSSAKNWDKSEDTILFAQWTPIPTRSFIISFNQNGGTGGQTTQVSVTYGSVMPALSGQTPTRDLDVQPSFDNSAWNTVWTDSDRKNWGYIFDGYFDDQAGGTKYYSADLTSAKNWDKAENTTLYARWVYINQVNENTLGLYDYIVPFAETAPVIDGNGSDTIWAKAQWRPIDQVWMTPVSNSFTPPANTVFSGRFKMLWTEDRLYYLAEIRDNIIIHGRDAYVNPENDDCLELFINSNGLGGNHVDNNTAIAYHMKLDEENAMDYVSGSRPNPPFRNGFIKRNHHLNYKVGNLNLTGGTAIGSGNSATFRYDNASQNESNVYTWEVEMKIYPAALPVDDNPETTPLAVSEKLTENRMMRFAVAYCDADATGSREYFMGNIFVPGSTANERNQAYLTADIYAKMYLVK